MVSLDVKHHVYLLSTTESGRDQEEGGELDSHEVLYYHLRVQARSRKGRRCWTLKKAQERSRGGRWSWAQKVGLLLPQLFLNSSATDIVLVTLPRTTVETATAWYTSCYAMARSPLPLQSCSGGGRRPPRSSWSEREVQPSLSLPFPPVPVPNKPSLFSGRKAPCLLIYYLLVV